MFKLMSFFFVADGLVVCPRPLVSNLMGGGKGRGEEPYEERDRDLMAL